MTRGLRLVVVVGKQLIGLYANLARLNLPYPEAVFDIGFFQGRPEPCQCFPSSQLYVVLLMLTVGLACYMQSMPSQKSCSQESSGLQSRIPSSGYYTIRVYSIRVSLRT